MKAPWVSACSKSKISFQHKPPRLVRWGFHPSPVGPLFVGTSETGAVCCLSFAKNRKSASCLKEWKKKWPNVYFIEDIKITERVISRLFRSSYPMHLLMIGTPFQHAIWKTIASIPPGKTLSYAQVARIVKRPKAVRAVGTACGSNPLPLVVPCHRVVASNGGLGGFGGGLLLKRRLLNDETKTS